MSVTGSGKVALGGDVASELGGSTPHKMSEYYRNGAYTGSNNTDVPTSGKISLSNFFGASAGVLVTVVQGKRTDIPTSNGYWKANDLLNASNNGFMTADSKGSRSPTTFQGVTIQGLYEVISTTPSVFTKFCIVMDGSRAKSWFTSADVQGGGLLLTANATHREYNGSTIWDWDITDYSTWDGTGNRTVTLV
jgi:hypothetical protein